jgi:catechol 2,3-dioxygenase-like lactoylglutathione lyase family enzyme
MISLHHTHLMASDLDATIAFWRDGFGGEVVHDVEFAGARNVFLRVGSGRIHLYDQPPKSTRHRPSRRVTGHSPIDLRLPGSTLARVVTSVPVAETEANRLGRIPVVPRYTGRRHWS